MNYFMQLKRGRVIKYERQNGIDILHVFLAVCYIYKTPIKGSYVFPEDEYDFYNDVEHFKFLRKYNL